MFRDIGFDIAQYSTKNKMFVMCAFIKTDKSAKKPEKNQSNKKRNENNQKEKSSNNNHKSRTSSSTSPDEDDESEDKFVPSQHVLSHKAITNYAQTLKPCLYKRR